VRQQVRRGPEQPWALALDCGNGLGPPLGLEPVADGPNRIAGVRCRGRGGPVEAPLLILRTLLTESLQQELAKQRVVGESLTTVLATHQHAGPLDAIPEILGQVERADQFRGDSARDARVDRRVAELRVERIEELLGEV
jgi:hypothetical protein